MAILIEKPTQVSRDHYLLKIKMEGTEPLPGQFINIKAAPGTDPLIRRPFSVFDHNEDITETVIRVVGKGTELLCGTEPGEMDILGPLGKGFTMEKNKKIMLAGGGVGNAPLYYLGKELKKMGNDITFIYGSRSDEYIYLEDKFRSFSSEFIISTDDGSAGKKGFVTDIAKELLKTEKFDRIYTCGPTPMMSGLVGIVGDNAPVEVSVENYFGCGIGLCVGCTIDTDCGFRRACIDGPVFDGKSINWDSLSH